MRILWLCLFFSGCCCDGVFFLILCYFFLIVHFVILWFSVLISPDFFLFLFWVSTLLNYNLASSHDDGYYPLSLDVGFSQAFLLRPVWLWGDPSAFACAGKSLFVLHFWKVALLCIIFLLSSVLSLRIFNISWHSFLICKVSSEKSSVTLVGIPLHVLFSELFCSYTLEQPDYNMPQRIFIFLAESNWSSWSFLDPDIYNSPKIWKVLNYYSIK